MAKRSAAMLAPAGCGLKHATRKSRPLRAQAAQNNMGSGPFRAVRIDALAARDLALLASAMDDRAGLGAAGEKAAERFLRRLKYRIVTRNYRCPAGELDLVVLDGKTVVFVEVKTRTGREHADPEDAVNSEKRRHIHRAAQFFIRQTGSEDRQFRFDVIAIVKTPSGELDIEHLPGAFAPA